MRFRALALGLAATAALGLGAAAHAATITFDELANDSAPSYDLYHTVTSGGFLFVNDGAGQASGDEFVVWSRTSSSNADPDGATLTNNYQGSITTVTKVGGGLFTLGAIDLANGFNSGGGGTVLFTFYTPDVANQGAFAVDSELVTLAGAPGLKTVTFNRSGLSSFTYQAIDANFVQVDNAVVDEFGPNTGVPEPGAWALMILGFGAAGSMLRRRRALAA
ncbi:PEPxxWA-CTERM sorting domain-containing protein [Phenylobacterium sp.]|uniref:PEPxxWA-CTERM sorting domain-containing protein n=1 Tax=Phenylobacterium sp. TaxID=1871053 RepID=UPI0025D850AF|nr:PEPxxWA-CTERM sorting domain-containing protein [Phenylobacterium sp.]MBX3486075.1 PEP-CTERM sorting domain-containing protein [Phenylobacterium sp.]MCW5760474.1 PEP-CTERM sorting domain-containing protein [Phenylobacterium sp.]